MAYDDLRYPSLAYKHKELPVSNLPAGRGVMPGKKRKEIKEVELKSGRGLVP